MSNDFGKIWLEALVELFGEVKIIREIQSEGKPKIYVFYFDNLPEEGTLTAVTCGLSNANHPDWKYGKPELIVSLDTSDHGWGLAAAYLASAFFNEKRFSYGDLFKLDDPFSNESPMNACFLFAPSFLDQEDSKFVLPDRTINLVGLYPIYEEEIGTYKNIGLEDFWHSEHFDLYNTQRLPVK